jgi:hypothetical protein
MSDQAINPPSSIKKCKYFLKGYCRYKTKCRYIHCQETLDKLKASRAAKEKQDKETQCYAISITCIEQGKPRTIQDSFSHRHRKHFNSTRDRILVCKRMIDSMDDGTYKNQALEQYYQLGPIQIRNMEELMEFSKDRYVSSFIDSSKEIMQEYIIDKYDQGCREYCEMWISAIRKMEKQKVFTQKHPGYHAWVEVKKTQKGGEIDHVLRFLLPEHILPRDDVFIAAYVSGTGIFASLEEKGISYGEGN